MNVVDVDQDGTITSAEARALSPDHTGVLVVFSTIIGLVVIICMSLAWLSQRAERAHQAHTSEAPGPTVQPAKEPAAPKRKT